MIYLFFPQFPQKDMANKNRSPHFILALDFLDNFNLQSSIKHISLNSNMNL